MDLIMDKTKGNFKKNLKLLFDTLRKRNECNVVNIKIKMGE